MGPSTALSVILLLSLAFPTPLANQEDQVLPDTASITDNIYRNDYFDFSYKFPADWRVLGPETHRNILEKGMDAGGLDPSEKEIARKLAERNFYTLLTVLPRSEVMRPGTRAGVGIVASNLSLHPGVVSGRDYLVQLNTSITSTPGGYELVEGPVTISIGNAEFSKTVHRRPKGDSTIYQAALASVQKGYLLLFTFVADTQESLNRLLETAASISFKESSP